MGRQQKRRLVNARSTEVGPEAEALESLRPWSELPREIVAMIASHTCPAIEPLPFTCLAQSVDPDSCAYHRQEDRTFSCPGGQFAPVSASVSQSPSQQPPAAASGSGGASGGGGGDPGGAGPSAAGAGSKGEAAAGLATVTEAVPGLFHPSQMSPSALAMRLVCRLWCQVLSDGVRRVLLQDPQPCTFWAPHFPSLSHLSLGSCTDFVVRVRDLEEDEGAGAGPGPSSAAAAAATAAATSGGRRRRPSRRGASKVIADAAAGGGGGGRSLAALLSLRNLQVADTAVHLDLAASCPQLEELVVCAQSQQQQYGTHPGREYPFVPVSAFGIGLAPGGLVGPARGGGGSAAAGLPTITRRSALDHTLTSLPGLRRLRLSGIDASAARLGLAMMALGALTSLRLHQCRLPTFLGSPASGRGRGSGNSFGRDLLMDLGAKLQDMSLQGCCLRTLPDEVLAGLTGLRMLDLSSNYLTSLPPTVTLLSRLEYLDVQQNALQSLPPGLGALSRLRDLDLSMNNLQRLPNDFGALTGLTHLHLGGMHALDIEQCLPQIAPLTNLHALGLCDVDLSDFAHPAAAPPAPALDAGGNLVLAAPPAPTCPLEVLAAAFGPAGRLRELLLDGCGLNTLPANFSQLSALSHLSIMENFDASGLPESITCLRQLSVLRLGYLDLSGPLPPGLFELPALRELDLEQNFLPRVPGAVSKLTTLQVLNLADALDPMASPDGAVPWAEIFSLPRLRQLMVSGQEEPGRVARGISSLTGLEVLSLRGIPMPAPVLEEICTALRSLSSLDLSSADISSLPTSVTRLVRLAELQLVSNRLSRLPTGFGALTRLTELGLRENPQLRALPADITRLGRLRTLSWTVSPAATQPPSAEQLAWMARLPELVLCGSCKFAELAKAHNIYWPKRSGYW